MKYGISKFVKILKIDNYYCLYNTLTQEVVFADYNPIQEGPSEPSSELLDIMNKEQFITTEEQDAELLQKVIKEKAKQDHNYSLLRILMTDYCNLDCKYCKVENNIKNKNCASINTKDIIDTLKLFQKTSPDNKKLVSITGGEPLLFPEKVKEIIELSKKYLDNYWIILFTNAILVNDEIADYLKRNKILVVISLDGIEKTHNKLRVFKNGLDSYNKVMQGYNMLKKKGCKIGFSCTVGTHNIDKLVEEMGYIIKKFKPDSLGINPLKYPSHDVKDSLYLPSPKQYAQVLFELYKKASRDGIFVEQVYRKVSPFIEKKFKYYDCGACGKNINLDAKGNMGPCKSFLILKKIYQTNKEQLDDNVFGRLFGRSTLQNNKCLSCEALGVCGGGCAYEAFVETGDHNKISEKGCIISKTLLNQLLKYVYEIQKNKITMAIKQKGFYHIKDSDRKKVNGKVKIQSDTLAYSVGHLV